MQPLGSRENKDALTWSRLFIGRRGISPNFLKMFI